jgi:hypothetical protein
VFCLQFKTSGRTKWNCLFWYALSVYVQFWLALLVLFIKIFKYAAFLGPTAVHSFVCIPFKATATATVSFSGWQYGAVRGSSSCLKISAVGTQMLHPKMASLTKTYILKHLWSREEETATKVLRRRIKYTKTRSTQSNRVLQYAITKFCVCWMTYSYNTKTKLLCKAFVNVVTV